jgi:ribose transport system substrate-binding protein
LNLKKSRIIAVVVIVIGFVAVYSLISLYRQFPLNIGGGGPVKIAVVIKSVEPSMEFWQVLLAGVKTAAQEFGVDVTIRGSSSEMNIDEQISIVEQIVKERPQAIVLAATDYNRLVPVAEKAKKAGIHLIMIDSGLNSSVQESFIATDNIAAGTKAGKALAERLGTKQAKVAIISFVKGTATQIDRERGVRVGLVDYPNIEVVGTYYSDGVEEKAYQITKELLIKHPGLNGIVGLNETSTVGVAKAIKELGRKGQVILIGFDSSLQEIQLIEEGIIQATVVQKPFNMGYLGIKTAVEIIRGETPDKLIDTGSEVITKDNMYSSENQKLLFPFVGK